MHGTPPLRVSIKANKEGERGRQLELFIIVVATKVAEKCITN